MNPKYAHRIYLDVVPCEDSGWKYRIYLCGTFAYSCEVFPAPSIARKYGVLEIMSSFSNYEPQEWMA